MGQGRHDDDLRRVHAPGLARWTVGEPVTVPCRGFTVALIAAAVIAAAAACSGSAGSGSAGRGAGHGCAVVTGIGIVRVVRRVGGPGASGVVQDISGRSGG